MSTETAWPAARVECIVSRMQCNRVNHLERSHCQRQASYLWGQKRIVKPELVPFEFGNGKRLIAIRPIATRRAHYVVAIDDSWDLNDDGGLREYLDQIYETIEDHFGRCWCESCAEPEDGERLPETGHECWPAICLEVGTEWWPL